MSYEFQNRVLSVSKTKQSQRLLMLTLALHADKYGVCWPSVNTLAKELNAAVRNTNALIARLKDSGEIIIIEGGGREISNTYIITLGQSETDIARILKTHPRLIGRVNPDDNIIVSNDINPDDSDINPDDSDINPDDNIIVSDDINPDDSGINPDDSGINPDDSGINPDDNIRRIDRIYRISESKKKTCAPAPAITLPACDPELGRCYNIYLNNMGGSLTDVLVQDIRTVYYSLAPPGGEKQSDWFEYAILEAQSNRKNSWSYVKKIVTAIANNGSLEKHKEIRQNGYSNRESETNGLTPGGRNQAQSTTNGHSGPPGESYAESYSRVNDENISAYMRRYSN